MGNWLLYAHAPNATKDLKVTRRSLNRMQLNLEKDVGVFVIFFGPTVKSPAVLSVFTNDSEQELLVLPNSGISNVPSNLKTFTDFLLTHRVQIDAVCFYCHGAGYGLGSWHGWSEPFLQLNDAVRILVEPFHVNLVVFDSCFQGAMSCLYELPTEVKYVLASPAFQPYVSVLWTKAFGKLRNKQQYTETHLKDFAHSMNCEWHTFTKAKWKCMLVFDTRYVRKIAELVKENISLLKFSKYSQIDKEDANLHDLYTAAERVPELQKIIALAATPTCSKCWQGCTKRVHGVSTEAHLPRKWIKCYTSTKWYKEIVKNKKGFEDRRLRD